MECVYAIITDDDFEQSGVGKPYFHPVAVQVHARHQMVGKNSGKKKDETGQWWVNIHTNFSVAMVTNNCIKWNNNNM